MVGNIGLNATQPVRPLSLSNKSLGFKGYDDDENDGLAKDPVLRTIQKGAQKANDKVVAPLTTVAILAGVFGLSKKGMGKIYGSDKLNISKKLEKPLAELAKKINKAASKRKPSGRIESFIKTVASNIRGPKKQGKYQTLTRLQDATRTAVTATGAAGITIGAAASRTDNAEDFSKKATGLVDSALGFLSNVS